ncbi:MAG: hypothetical protein WA775_02925 [Psychroserpens sp.]|uniref:hypothetical protein n=1 Tax=Psychroserpens sp. TaxID=2020870 RepID=UPI003C8340AB
MLTTYTVKFRETDKIWEFNYHLNGDFSSFNLLEGNLSEKQKTWLFRQGNFPSSEILMKEEWIVKQRKHLEITVGDFDLSFDNFWMIYDNKVGKKKMARNIWERMSKSERIKVFINIPKYKAYLKQYPNQQMLYPTSYLNQEAYTNDWKIK